MKTGPHIVVVVTTAFALGAGVVLASEDTVLFDPQQTMLEALMDDTDLGDVNSNDGRVLYAPQQDSARP